MHKDICGDTERYLIKNFDCDEVNRFRWNIPEYQIIFMPLLFIKLLIIISDRLIINYIKNSDTDYKWYIPVRDWQKFTKWTGILTVSDTLIPVRDWGKFIKWTVILTISDTLIPVRDWGKFIKWFSYYLTRERLRILRIDNCSDLWRCVPYLFPVMRGLMPLLSGQKKKQ